MPTLYVWDVTKDNAPKSYENESVWLRKLCNDDFSFVH